MATTVYFTGTATPAKFGYWQEYNATEDNRVHPGLYETANTGAGTSTAATTITSAVAMWGITPPLASGVTISSAITAYVYGMESNAMANVTFTFSLYKLDTMDVLTLIGTSGQSAELGTTKGLVSFSYTPTSTALSAGDRLYIQVQFAGSQGSGYTATAYYGGDSTNTADSRVVFTDTLSFQTFSEPSGSQLYLSPVHSPVKADYLKGGYDVRPRGLESYYHPQTNKTYTMQINVNVPSGNNGNELQNQYVDANGVDEYAPFYTRRLKSQTVGGVLKFYIAIAQTYTGGSCSFNCGAKVYKRSADGTTGTLLCVGRIGNTTTSGANYRTGYVLMPDTSFSEGEWLYIEFWQNNKGSAGWGSFYTGNSYQTYVQFSSTLQYSPFTYGPHYASVPDTFSRQIHNPAVTHSHRW